MSVRLCSLLSRVILPVLETGGSSQPVSPVERTKVPGPEVTPGLLAVLKTDCHYCPHHMMSYPLNPLETVSLRGRRDCGEGKKVKN